MSRPRTPVIGGNWKMNTNTESSRALAEAVGEGCRSIDGVEVFVCPPFPYLRRVGGALKDAGGGVALAAQDVWHEPDGAFTGEVSAAMLLDCGVSMVLTGHSERRHVIGEDDGLINKKTIAALNAGLSVVLCIGETLDQREKGETDAVNERQLRAGLNGVTPEQMASVIVAYEPVWAIGTGKTATPEDAQDAHTKIRDVIGDLYGADIAAATRIQYGGSVKPGNAAELFSRPDIDGGLIGGASLKADDFLAIIRSATG